MKNLFDTVDHAACPTAARSTAPVLRRRCGAWLVGLSMGAAAQAALAQTPFDAGRPVPASADAAPQIETFSSRGQFTSVTQKHPTIASPYQGTNSLRAFEPAMETVDLTLFLGVRLWRGAALYFDPEIDQGYGFTNTQGVAGFPSGEAYKVGNWTPYYRTPRLFLRQTIALGSSQSKVEAGPNVLAGLEPDDKLTLTVGKLSIADIFDANTYAHDPRADFLNWSVIESGAFDYAADSWGYTYGAALEWTAGDWTLRGGYFALSTRPNVETLDTTFKQYSMVLEAEKRYRLADRPGTVRLLSYIDHGRIARYDDAVALAVRTNSAADAALVRHEATKSGWAINLEQELADGIGGFARLSGNDGKHEGYDFTDINRSISTGLAIKSARWKRPEDTAGVAVAMNALSGDARAFFAAGGVGILIGDGQLPHYGAERVVEVYYSARINPKLSVAADYQAIANPGYNRDRGPVRVYGLRLHAEF